MMKKSLKLMCISVLLSTGLIVRPIAVNGEENREIQVPTSLKVQQATLVTPDSFRLGIDEYVTGFLDTSVKKVVLYVNDQNIRNGYVYSDGTFEVEAGDVINNIDDKVEIVGLDRRNKELDRQTVSLEKSEIKFIAEDFALFDEEIRGVAGNQMSVVSLIINDELIRSINVNSDDSFIMPVESGDIIDTDDFVELVGSNSGKEVARITIPVNNVDLQLGFNDFEFGIDTVITGKLSGKAQTKAKTVQLYVNRKRYAKATLNADGTFSVDSERNINNWKDTVTVAVLDKNNEELGRFQLGLSKKYGTTSWSWDEATQTVIFGGGEFPDSNEEYNIQTQIQNDRLVNGTIEKIVFAEPVKAAVNSSYAFSRLEYCSDIQWLDNFDTSEVENMSNMFTGMRPFDGELDVSSFDTSNVTNMSHMFSEMLYVKGINVNGFDTRKVTTMKGMFFCTPQSGYSRVETLDVSSFDTSNVTDMSYMFHGLAELKKLDVSNFDTTSVTDMSMMFGFNLALRELDISSFDTSNVQNKYSAISPEGPLEKLILGAKSIFKDSEYVYARPGRWMSPDEKTFESFEELLQNYDGSVPGTYTRELAEWERDY